MCAQSRIIATISGQYWVYETLITVFLFFRKPTEPQRPTAKENMRGKVVFVLYTLHCTSLHFITLHKPPLHYTAQASPSLHYTVHKSSLHYITLHYTAQFSTAIHWTSLHLTTLYKSSLHYTAQASTSLH